MAINEWSTTAANNATGVTGVNWAEGMPPSGVNDSARAVMADVATWYGQASGKMPEGLTSIAGTNTITATGPSAMAAYAANQRFILIPAGTNTGATTLNITPSGASALGAKNVYFNGAACAGGEIIIGVPVVVVYDGTQFQIVGPSLPATQTQQEAAATNGVFVTPGRQQFHPSACKGWAEADSAGAVAASYNLTSVTDDGVGLITFTWGTDFSSTAYCAVASIKIDFGAAAATTYAIGIDNTNFMAGATHCTAARVSDGALIDPNHWMIVAFGDQA